MPMNKLFVVGLVGNVTSFAVYASPIPTFSIICRKKSTEMFSVVPYIFTLLTAVLGVYYGMLKSSGGLLIMTVNGLGAIFEISYIIMFYLYTGKATRKKIWKLVIAEVLFCGCLVCVTKFATHGKMRIIVTGSVSSAIAIAMYASPLSIMRTVIRTKNVEAMPLTLSIFLLINGVIWSGYAFLAKDIFIGVRSTTFKLIYLSLNSCELQIPSVAGSLCATGQVVLYVVCKICRDKQMKRQQSESEKGEAKQHIIEMNQNGNGDHNYIPPIRQTSGTPRSVSGALRTASGRVLELIKEIPNGLVAAPVYRTPSGKMLKESPVYRTPSGTMFMDTQRYVELVKT